jgi:NAD(P)-dependent dehydrogenase (short-subunit alcohol dehydrogenase family)
MKSVLVTGASDGIGLETARQCLQQGCKVLVHGRNPEKARRAAARLSAEVAGARADAVWGDLGDMAQVVGLARQIAAVTPLLDVLINNAGVYERRRRITVDGFEATMAVNHFAPFLLTRALLPQLQSAPAARIVSVSSIAHHSGSLDLNDLDYERHYDPYGAYAASKLANILFTVELAKRLRATRVTANALHPGVIGTKLLRSAFNMQGASVQAGARTSVYLATSAEVAGVTGKYFDDCREAEPSHAVTDSALAAKLWQVTESRLADFLER